MFNAMGYNASNWQRQDLNSCLTGSKAAFNYYLINYLLFPATNLVNILPSHGSYPHPLPAFTTLPPFLPSHVLSALHLPFAHIFLLGCPLAFLDLPIPVAIIPGLQILLVSWDPRSEYSLTPYFYHSPSFHRLCVPSVSPTRAARGPEAARGHPPAPRAGVAVGGAPRGPPFPGSPRAQCSLGEHGRFRCRSRAGAGLTAAPARRTPPSAPPARQPRRSLRPFPPAAPAAPWRRARAARASTPSRRQHGRPAWIPCPGNLDTQGPAQRPEGMRGAGTRGMLPSTRGLGFSEAAPEFLPLDLRATSPSLSGAERLGKRRLKLTAASSPLLPFVLRSTFMPGWCSPSSLLSLISHFL